MDNAHAANETLALLQAETSAVDTPRNTVNVDGKEYRVMVYSWGYEQTNIEFYAVIKETEKTISLRRLGTAVVEENGYMSTRVVPAASWLEDAVKRKRKANAPGKPLSCAGIDGYGWTMEWSGRPETETHYH